MYNNSLFSLFNVIIYNALGFLSFGFLDSKIVLVHIYLWLQENTIEKCMTI